MKARPGLAGGIGTWKSTEGNNSTRFLLIRGVGGAGGQGCNEAGGSLGGAIQKFSRKDPIRVLNAARIAVDHEPNLARGAPVEGAHGRRRQRMADHGHRDRSPVKGSQLKPKVVRKA